MSDKSNNYDKDKKPSEKPIRDLIQHPTTKVVKKSRNPDSDRNMGKKKP